MEKPVIKTQESDVKYLSLGYQNIDFNVGIFWFFETRLFQMSHTI